MNAPNTVNMLTDSVQYAVVADSTFRPSDVYVGRNTTLHIRKGTTVKIVLEQGAQADITTEE